VECLYRCSDSEQANILEILPPFPLGSHSLDELEAQSTACHPKADRHRVRGTLSLTAISHLLLLSLQAKVGESIVGLLAVVCGSRGGQEGQTWGSMPAVSGAQLWEELEAVAWLHRMPSGKEPAESESAKMHNGFKETVIRCLCESLKYPAQG